MRSLLSALQGTWVIAVFCALALLINFMSVGQTVKLLNQNTEAKFRIAQKVEAAHNKELVAIYEKALIGCLYGEAISIGKTAILCYPTQVSP